MQEEKVARRDSLMSLVVLDYQVPEPGPCSIFDVFSTSQYINPICTIMAEYVNKKPDRLAIFRSISNRSHNFLHSTIVTNIDDDRTPTPLYYRRSISHDGKFLLRAPGAIRYRSVATPLPVGVALIVDRAEHVVTLGFGSGLGAT